MEASIFRILEKSCFFDFLPFGAFMSKISFPRVVFWPRIIPNWPSKVPRKKNSTFLKFRQANQKGLQAKKSPLEVIFCSYKHQKAIIEKTGFLQNTENGCLHFKICYTLYISAQLSLVNFFEKMMGTWFYLPGRFLGRNHGRTNFWL